MLLNNSSTLINSNSAAVETHNGGGGGGGSDSGDAGTIPAGGGFSDEDKARIEVGESGGSGIRWPRQETLELLRIRSEMEAAFRDSNLKGPLWEEVSRKMSKLGYRRNGKKCKEKFENVYKYHKRTKDGRASKSDGKTYRFFQQLEALEKNPSSRQQPGNHTRSDPPTYQNSLPSISDNKSVSTHVTVSSAPAAGAAAINPVSFSPGLNNNPLFSSPSFSIMPPVTDSAMNISSSLLLQDEFTSSSTSSDEDIRRIHKRKRKFKNYFERLSNNMMEKLEDLHRKLLEKFEKRDRERMIRDEAWRVQEMARMNRELDLLNQERSMVAIRDATIVSFLHNYAGHERSMAATKVTAIISFLQNYTGQENIKRPLLPPSRPLPSENSQPSPAPPISQITTPTPAPPALAPPPPLTESVTETERFVSYELALTTRDEGNGGENFMTTSSSRWPKMEIEALIKLRSNLDIKYQDNCPKGSLWEEISTQMSKIGYSRNAKRCKEKWENINKYFKKVKESNKRRHEDSKTCPYFHQLDALYKEKANNPFHISYPNAIKPETPVPIMARPEQQWPIQMQGSAMERDEDHDSDNFDENDDGEEDHDKREGHHEMVTNQRQASMSLATATAAG